MSEKVAEIYDRGLQSSTSATEAWADLETIAEEADWDVEQMVSDPEDT